MLPKVEHFDRNRNRWKTLSGDGRLGNSWGFETNTTLNVVFTGRHSYQLIGKVSIEIQTQPNFHKVQSCLRTAVLSTDLCFFYSDLGSNGVIWNSLSSKLNTRSICYLLLIYQILT
jgi:hypothetical protein